jgi:hypothetical protein
MPSDMLLKPDGREVYMLAKSETRRGSAGCEFRTTLEAGGQVNKGKIHGGDGGTLRSLFLSRFWVFILKHCYMRQVKEGNLL